MASRGSRNRVPDFFIVGHPKSGTSALYRMLRSHPEIFVPHLKEPWYFSTDLRPRYRPRRDPFPKPETLEQYTSLFDGAAPDQIAGEGSPHYLWSRTAANGIADVQPAARIIAILREPASFLHSFHLQLLQKHIETEQDLRRAISLEEQRRQGKRLPRRCTLPQLLQYSEQVRYVEQLGRYRAVFPPEQMLVLIYDDYRSDNEATVRRVHRFLGVDDTRPIVVTDANPTVRVRSQRLHELVHAISAGEGRVTGALHTTIRTLAPRKLERRSALAIRDRIMFTAPPAPDETLMNELRKRFRPEVQATSEYLERDLVTLWGYDRIG